MIPSPGLQAYGWSDALQRQFQPHAARGLIPGRVVVQQRGLYRLATDQGELSAEVSGRFVHEAGEAGFPVAGDWAACAARPQEGAATIHALLPRSSLFVRKASGPGQAAQAVAANVDVALLVASLNADLNPRRLERYLAVAWESGAQPVVVLTKADACPDVEAAVARIEAVAVGVEVHAVSAVTGQGLEGVAALLAPGRTAVLLGSSGVGKSTLVNALAGTELMAVGEIRQDDERGRHTTTHRELIRLPSGALMLDTPGMRELGLWDAEAGLAATFADVEREIEALSAQCRYRNCGHRKEPGCAVREAVEDGRLDEGRWKSWVKLQRELAHLDRREDPVAAQAHRKHWIGISKANRAEMRRRNREQEG
ncbi:MAG TPA: ribosome small subunit-dependent GTPase A [Phenylobacterium sp.]|nr:ribosome small subunit-dependent GTPase A [Phenylobacterium sp.]